MKAVWALQDAKNRFSELVAQALQEGPQIVTRRGKETVVVLSVQEFHQLTRAQESLVAFFRASPLVGVELEVTRDKDPGREVAL
jgi:prevent-host-death family protein